jgi:hypothetical protein
MFTGPKLSIFYVFEHQRGLFDTRSYDLHSSVPLGIFQVFVRSVKTGIKVAGTKENAGVLSLLTKEFWLEDLLSDWSSLQKASVAELRKPESISGTSHLMQNRFCFPRMIRKRLLNIPFRK